MKKQELRQLIKEEINRILTESTSKEEIVNKIKKLQDSDDYTTEEESEFKLGDYFVHRYEDLKGEGEFAVWKEDQRDDSDPQPYLETDSPEEVAEFLLSKLK